MIFAGLYCVTPGVFLGGMNYITADSRVRVIQQTYTRVNIVGSHATGFEMTHREEHELNAEQIAELRRLLRGSWYTRSFRRGMTYRMPMEVDSYYQYWISISNGNEHVTLTFTWSGRILRGGGGYNDSFRIRNGSWEEVLLEILSSTDE